MAVERFHGSLQFDRQVLWVQGLGLATPLFRHLGADVLPEIAKLGHLLARQVVGHGHTRQLDDAAFDGVHQREIAHGPGKQRAFDVAGTAEKKWRGRQVHDSGKSQLPVDGLQPVDPQSRSLLVFFGFLALVTLERSFVGAAGFFAVAVVGLVVDGHDVLQAHQFRHDPLQHLALGFQCAQLRPASALQQLATTLG